MRASFADSVKLYAPGVTEISDKDELLKLLHDSMEESADKLRAAGDELKNTMKRFDGKEMPKLAFMSFAIAHEIERLLATPMISPEVPENSLMISSLETSQRGDFLPPRPGP